METVKVPFIPISETSFPFPFSVSSKQYISFPIPGEFHGTNGTHGKPHELLTSRPE